MRFYLGDATGLDLSRSWSVFDGDNNLLASAPIDVTKRTEGSPVISLTTVLSGTPSALIFRLVAAEPPSQPVPEPGSVVALVAGLVGLVGFGIRRRK